VITATHDLGLVEDIAITVSFSKAEKWWPKVSLRLCCAISLVGSANLIHAIAIATIRENPLAPGTPIPSPRIRT